MTLAYATDFPIADMPTPDLWESVKRIGEYKLAARLAVWPHVERILDELRPLNGRIDALMREEADRTHRGRKTGA